MSPPLVERVGRVRRWLLPAALVAFAPKCLLCLAAYVGLGTAALGSRELCGASSSGAPTWLLALMLLAAPLCIRAARMLSH